MNEEWKEIEGYSSYEVSSKGQIRDKQTQEIKSLLWNGNFLCINLIADDGTKSLCKVHRLVACTFIPNPENAHNVVHKDEDRSNNSTGNLFWKAKRIKEVIVKEVKTLTFLNKTYTYPEFCEAVGCEISILKSRLSLGWSVRECFTGLKEFTEQGYSGEGMWFTNKKDLQKHLWNKELERREANKLQKQADKETRIQARKDYKKYGVGVFENFPIIGILNRKQTKPYMVWSSMLARCYSENHHSYGRYGGRGVRVCDAWLIFQNFASWYTTQYAEEGWHIDKDIIGASMLYSPETCCVIPAEINTLVATFGNSDRDLPTGVCKTHTEGVYSVQFVEDGERKALTIRNLTEAALIYKDKKESELKKIADKWKDKIDVRVYNYLYNYEVPINQ